MSRSSALDDAPTDEPVPTLFETLVDTTCQFCDDGTLSRGEYKGNDAVVCDVCDTPAVQSW